MLPILATLFLAFMPTGAAESHDPDLPAPDPHGYWRYVTQKDKTSTSKCIGDPKTPVCAVDTVMACSARYDDSICEKVNYLWGYNPDSRVGVDSGEFARYRIFSSRRLKASDIPPHRQVGKGSWKQGDLQVTVHRKYCGYGGCGELPPGETTFTLRKVGDKWTVVFRFIPREQ